MPCRTLSSILECWQHRNCLLPRTTSSWSLRHMGPPHPMMTYFSPLSWWLVFVAWCVWQNSPGQTPYLSGITAKSLCTIQLSSSPMLFPSGCLGTRSTTSLKATDSFFGRTLSSMPIHISEHTWMCTTCVSRYGLNCGWALMKQFPHMHGSSTGCTFLQGQSLANPCGLVEQLHWQKLVLPPILFRLLADGPLTHSTTMCERIHSFLRHSSLATRQCNPLIASNWQPFSDSLGHNFHLLLVLLLSDRFSPLYFSYCWTFALNLAAIYLFWYAPHHPSSYLLFQATITPSLLSLLLIWTFGFSHISNIFLLGFPQASGWGSCLTCQLSHSSCLLEQQESLRNMFSQV